MASWSAWVSCGSMRNSGGDRMNGTVTALGSAVSSPRSSQAWTRGRARPDVTDANRQRGNARRIDETGPDHGQRGGGIGHQRHQQDPGRAASSQADAGLACAPGRRPTPGDMPVAGREASSRAAQRIVDQALLLRLVAPAHPNRAAILLDPQHQAAALADGAHRLPAVGIEHFRGERQARRWASGYPPARASLPASDSRGAPPLRRWAPRCANWTSARSRRPCRWGRGRHCSTGRAAGWESPHSRGGRPGFPSSRQPRPWRLARGPGRSSRPGFVPR